MRAVSIIFICAFILIAAAQMPYVSGEEQYVPPDIPHIPGAAQNALTGFVTDTGFSSEQAGVISSLGFAPPWDVFNDNQVIMTPEITSDGVLLFRVQYPTSAPAITFARAYIYNTELGSWTSFQVAGSPVNNLPSFRQGSLVIVPPQELVMENGANYVAAYLCSNSAVIPHTVPPRQRLNCGCRAPDDCGYWNVQQAVLGTPELESDLDLPGGRDEEDALETEEEPELSQDDSNGADTADPTVRIVSQGATNVQITTAVGGIAITTPQTVTLTNNYDIFTAPQTRSGLSFVDWSGCTRIIGRMCVLENLDPGQTHTITAVYINPEAPPPTPPTGPAGGDESSRTRRSVSLFLDETPPRSRVTISGLTPGQAFRENSMIYSSSNPQPRQLQAGQGNLPVPTFVYNTTAGSPNRYGLYTATSTEEHFDYYWLYPQRVAHASSFGDIDGLSTYTHPMFENLDENEYIVFLGERDQGMRGVRYAKVGFDQTPHVMRSEFSHFRFNNSVRVTVTGEGVEESSREYRLNGQQWRRVFLDVGRQSFQIILVSPSYDDIYAHDYSVESYPAPCSNVVEWTPTPFNDEAAYRQTVWEILFGEPYREDGSWHINHLHGRTYGDNRLVGPNRISANLHSGWFHLRIQFLIAVENGFVTKDLDGARTSVALRRSSRQVSDLEQQEQLSVRAFNNWWYEIRETEVWLPAPSCPS